MANIVERVLHAGEGKRLKVVEKQALEITALEPEISALTDEQLRAMTVEFRQRLADGETLDDLLPEAFAVVREAAKRTLGQRPFDVQLMGGASLHTGNIAEMKTGEGKTLTGVSAGLPERARRQGRARRHGQRLPGQARRRVDGPASPLPRARGRRDPGRHGRPTTAARPYAADITYGTNNEFGFDYLRDNMAWRLDECVQRGHNFAIVDEVDSILIDEARTPLIICGPAEQSPRWYTEFAKIAPRLRRGEDGEGDYEVDEKKRTVGIMESGVEKVEDWLGIDNLYDAGQHAAGQPPEQRAQGQGAVQEGQGLRRDERRGPDRGRVHRPHPARPALQRGHAPGHRGQGGRADQGREPDARHDHPAELLPALRQAGRHDRHGHDRGRRVPRRSTSSAWSRSRPTCR